MALTNYARNFIQDNVLGGVSYSPPTNYYLALSTTTISSSGSNMSEPSGAGYARVLIPNSKSYFSYATTGSVVVSGSVAYPISTGSWGTIVDVALCDASTSGSIWLYTTLASPKIVQDSTTLSFSASAIKFSIA